MTSGKLAPMSSVGGSRTGSAASSSTSTPAPKARGRIASESQVRRPSSPTKSGTLAIAASASPPSIQASAANGRTRATKGAIAMLPRPTPARKSTSIRL